LTEIRQEEETAPSCVSIGLQSNAATGLQSDKLFDWRHWIPSCCHRDSLRSRSTAPTSQTKSYTLKFT